MLYDGDACYLSGMWSDMRFMLLCSNGHTDEYRLGKFPYKEKRVDWCPLEEQKAGRWVIERGGTVMHCDCCGWALEYFIGFEVYFRYCPHCGANMESEGAE